MPKPFGKYVLLRRLATGGMGEIFLARPQAGGAGPEHLVIKRILPHLAEDSEFRDMFLDEARIAARLHHPNVVEIFEVGEVGDAVYLAMEYVHGEDLRRVERAARTQGKRIPLEAATRIVAAAAAGLEHAHGLAGDDGRNFNLVHRDVSPQNVLVGYSGEVKLIDFGVAKAVGLGQPTITGVLKGKCAYMSPEQAAGETIDSRSDVFSLGVVFWELLTGRRLFKGSSDQMTMRLVLGCQGGRAARLNPALPDAVDAVAFGALAKHPKDRYPDARTFRVALERLLDAQGLSQVPLPHASLVRDLFPTRWRQAPEDEAEEAVETADEESDRFYGVGAQGTTQDDGGLRRLFSKDEEEHTVTLSAAPRASRGWLIAAGFAVVLALGTLALLLG